MPARNLGEVQSFKPEKIKPESGANQFKTGEMKARNISTSVDLGERKMDSFPKRKTMQDFLDSKDKP